MKEADMNKTQIMGILSMAAIIIAVSLIVGAWEGDTDTAFVDVMAAIALLVSPIPARYVLDMVMPDEQLFGQVLETDHEQERKTDVSEREHTS